MFSDSILVNDVNDIEIDVAADPEAGFLTRVVIGSGQTHLDLVELISLIASLQAARDFVIDEKIKTRHG